MYLIVLTKYLSFVVFPSHQHHHERTIVHPSYQRQLAQGWDYGVLSSTNLSHEKTMKHTKENYAF